MPFVPKKQAFNAHINEVVLGVGEKATAIGGQNVLPFHWFDGESLCSGRIVRKAGNPDRYGR